MQKLNFRMSAKKVILLYDDCEDEPDGQTFNETLPL
jgi:hypothetical protein